MGAEGEGGVGVVGRQVAGGGAGAEAGAEAGAGMARGGALRLPRSSRTLLLPLSAAVPAAAARTWRRHRFRAPRRTEHWCFRSSGAQKKRRQRWWQQQQRQQRVETVLAEVPLVMS